MTGKRGFAAMSKLKHKAAATVGGTNAQARGTGHRLGGEAAKAAGRKGGLARAAKLRAQREAAEAAGSPGTDGSKDK